MEVTESAESVSESVLPEEIEIGKDCSSEDSSVHEPQLQENVSAIPAALKPDVLENEKTQSKESTVLEAEKKVLQETTLPEDEAREEVVHSVKIDDEHFDENETKSGEEGSSKDDTTVSELTEAMESCEQPLQAAVAVACCSGGLKENSNASDENRDSIYHIKWISQNNHKTPVVTQNENGPCPLIAIMNVLILRGRVKLPSTVDIVTSEKLMQHLSDCILDSIPKNIPEGTQLNYEQNVNDAMVVLPKLQTGLDVNVKFTGIRDFEYTPECVIFDLLGIPLYHGWLIDPQMTEVVQAVGKCSYNQLVEKIINCKSSLDPDRATEALVAENFLEKTASQLTYHGLCELTSSLHEAELCVLFRNNHFSSLVKQNNVLYQLVTDQGFLNENVVWETLNNIEGDGQFVDSNFILVPPKPINDVALPPDISTDQQINQDFLVALSMEEDQKNLQRNELEWEEYKKKNLTADDIVPDEELARRLQLEEGSSPRQQQLSPRYDEPVPSTANRQNKSRDCVIL